MYKLFLTTVCLFFLLAGCVTTRPEIIPDNTGDSVVMLQVKDAISQPGVVKATVTWLWWYAPVCFIALMWAVKTFFMTKCECDPNCIKPTPPINEE